MMSRSKMKLVNILIVTAWAIVVFVGLLLIVISSRASQLPLENAIHFTTGLMPQVFFVLVGWVMILLGSVLGAWWYYEYFYGKTIYIRTPYGELEIHKVAIRGYLEQQLALMPEVVDYEVFVAIRKRRFVSLDIRVFLTSNKSCREYGEKLQQDILQMLLSTFAIKDIKHFHLEIDSFLGGECRRKVVYQ